MKFASHKTMDAVDKLRATVYYVANGDITKPNPKLEALIDDIISEEKMTTKILGFIQKLIWEMR